MYYLASRYRNDKAVAGGDDDDGHAVARRGGDKVSEERKIQSWREFAYWVQYDNLDEDTKVGSTCHAERKSVATHCVFLRAVRMISSLNW